MFLVGTQYILGEAMMIESKQIERLEQSRVRLSVTIKQDEAQKEYRKLLQEYSKNAQIKGFRPGKVPETVLEQKFGESIRMDAAQKLIEESLKVIYGEIDEKPLSFSPPVLESNLDFSPGGPFSYTVSYDIFPQLDLKKLSGFTVEEPQVSIGKDALNHELERLRQQNAIVIDKSEGTVEKDHVVTINYCLLDETGTEIADSHREDYTLTAGTESAPYDLGNDIIGMECGEEKTIEKASPDESDTDEQKTRIKVKITGIKERELPDIDDELAQDINTDFETLDDLKKDINRQLNETKNDRLKEVRATSLMEKIIDANPIILPESMIGAELDGSWQSFIQKFGGDEKTMEVLLQAQNRTRDDLYKEWRPAAEKRLKSQLITQKLIEDRKIEATEEELAEKIKETAEKHSMTSEKLREYYEQNKMIEYLKHDIMKSSLIHQLLEENTVKKGKKIKYLDFVQTNM